MFLTHVSNKMYPVLRHFLYVPSGLNVIFNVICSIWCSFFRSTMFPYLMLPASPRNTNKMILVLLWTKYLWVVTWGWLCTFKKQKNISMYLSRTLVPWLNIHFQFRNIHNVHCCRQRWIQWHTTEIHRLMMYNGRIAFHYTWRETSNDVPPMKCKLWKKTILHTQSYHLRFIRTSSTVQNN